MIHSMCAPLRGPQSRNKGYASRSGVNRGTESRTFNCPQRAAIAPLIKVASHGPPRTRTPLGLSPTRQVLTGC